MLRSINSVKVLSGRYKHRKSNQRGQSTILCSKWGVLYERMEVLVYKLTKICKERDLKGHYSKWNGILLISKCIYDRIKTFYNADSWFTLCRPKDCPMETHLRQARGTETQYDSYHSNKVCIEESKLYKRHPEYTCNWFVIKILTFQLGFPKSFRLISRSKSCSQFDTQLKESLLSI